MIIPPFFYIPGYYSKHPPRDAPVIVEEQFSPVRPLLKYSDINTVIAQANATGFGSNDQQPEGHLIKSIRTTQYAIYQNYQPTFFCNDHPYFYSTTIV
jgi:hypothetical protein